MRLDRFRVGWNDVANCVNPWTGSDTYATPCEWINRLLKQQKGLDKSADDGYLAGVAAACQHYLANRATLPRLEAP